MKGKKRIKVRNPLRLLPYQTGLLVTPQLEAAGIGQQDLDAKQTAIKIGETIPIVFCRRVDGVGGVLVSPGATEGRYENNASTNALTVRLHLVLSEGELPKLQLRDVFQRACRVGTWKQTYNQRAGSWTAGNFITTVSGFEKWDCPVYCGTSGVYTNLTTLSYTNTFGPASVNWDKQVHCFVREGMQVTRIIDSTYGPSNNVVDLALYLLRQSSRLPEDMLDTAGMLTAAQFTNTNGLLYNGLFKDSTNLEDWLQDVSTNFLLRLVDRNGKKSFRPRLPVNDDHTIKTTAISWVFGFTEEHILPNGFEIEYIPLSERKPICALMLWRQQPNADIGILRATEVRFNGEAVDGPFEQYDLTAFCTSEAHAVKIGAYIVARRKYITHTLRIQVKPDAYNSTLVLGDIVRVQLRRETDVSAITLHDYLYEVERISKNNNGVVELELTHFPVDDQNRSLIAQNVAVANGTGYSLPTGRDDFTCDDAGRDTDTTPLDDEGGNLPNLPAGTNFESLLNGLGESQPVGGIDNPADPVVSSTNSITDNRINPANPLTIGDTLNLVPPCPDGKVDWYRRDKATGARTLIKSEPLGGGWEAGSSLQITTDDIDYFLEAEASCPDPSSPTGFGTPVPATLADGTTPEPQLDCDNSAYVVAPTCSAGAINGGTLTLYTQYGSFFQVPADAAPGRFVLTEPFNDGGVMRVYAEFRSDSGTIYSSSPTLKEPADAQILSTRFNNVTCSSGGTPSIPLGPCDSKRYENYDPSGTVTYMTIEGNNSINTDLSSGASPRRYPADTNLPFEYWILGEGTFPTQDLHIVTAFVQDKKDGGFRILGLRQNGDTIGLWTGLYSDGTPTPITWSNTATKPAYP